MVSALVFALVGTDAKRFLGKMLASRADAKDAQGWVDSRSQAGCMKCGRSEAEATIETRWDRCWWVYEWTWMSELCDKNRGSLPSVYKVLASQIANFESLFE